jgi:hypothetical protein
MTASLFEEWFFQFFVPDVKKHLRRQNLPEKAILLLDNCAAHPQGDVLQTTDGQIKVVYLPKNTTSKIQPCDAGIIHAFKSVYKKELILEMLDSPLNVTEFLKQLTIKDAIYISGRAWDAVTTKTITNCWNKSLGAAFPRSGDTEEEVDILFNEEQMVAAQEQLGSNLLVEETITLQDWVNDWETAEDEITETEMLTDSEIVDQIRHEVDEDEDTEEVETPAIELSKTHTEAVSHIKWLIEYTESQDYDPVFTFHLKNLLRKTQVKMRKSMKQRKMTDYIKQ